MKYQCYVETVELFNYSMYLYTVLYPKVTNQILPNIHTPCWAHQKSHWRTEGWSPLPPWQCCTELHTRSIVLDCPGQKNTTGLVPPNLINKTSHPKGRKKKKVNFAKQVNNYLLLLQTATLVFRQLWHQNL